jgi:hypothetical protein
MKKAINRRGFLRTGLTAGTAISLPVSVWADDYPSDIVAMTALQLSEAIREKKSKLPRSHAGLLHPDKPLQPSL